MLPEELDAQLNEQIKKHDVFTRIYRDHIESCKIFDEYDNVVIVGTRQMDIGGRPIQVLIAMTDTEFDSGLDFQNFGKNCIVVLPRSIYEAMFSDPVLMSAFDRAFRDRLSDLPDYKGTGETGIVRFMRRTMNENMG